MPPVSATKIPTPEVLQSGGFATPSGTIVTTAYRFFLDLVTYITSLVQAINAAVGVNSFTLAGQPALGPADAGFLGFVTDYGHFVKWNGVVWSFAPGDVENGFRRDFAIVPQGVGWQLMDGTATDYLVVGGAALTTLPYVTPNLTGNPAYPKSAAAYTGAIVPANAPAMTGQTADESAHTHVVPDQNTADESAHTHNVPGQNAQIVSGGVGANTESAAPTTPLTAGVVAVNTGAGTAHHHDVPSQATQAGSAHHHAAGTLAADATGEPVHVGWLPYWRR